MPKVSGSRVLAQMLQAYGVTHVFFVPAIALEALAEMEDMDIRRVLTHGEKASAYMADGYARASGKPGICLAQHIGASNLAAGLRDAYMGGSPVIAITGGPTPQGRYRHAYQEVEDHGQFDAVTKYNVHVEDVKRLPDFVRQAFREATSGAPGPVHLQLRGNHGQIANEHAELRADIESRYASVPPFRPLAQAEDVASALEQLRTAERPIIVAGGGVVASGAREELIQLAETLEIPIATSLNGKDVVPDRHPLAVGVVGTYSRECANRALHEADLAFFVGSHLGGQVTHGWQLPSSQARVIQLDIAPSELGRNRPNSASLHGDAKAVLRQLLDSVSTRTRHRPWMTRVTELVSAWRRDTEPMLTSEALPMRPERICREISRALPDNAIVVSDTGHAGIWSGTMIELSRPGQRYIRCAGSMGWGFPASLGVKCARPQSTVVCFTGDGAMYYHLAELETAARYGINVIVVVNNNSAINQEIPLFDKAYGGVQRGRADEMWRFLDINFARVAESLGCVGLRADSPAGLRTALAKALTFKRPVVIDAISDVSAFSVPPWTPQGRSN
jgi:acetolactate synthase I/II/III large subunit